ncbi:flagellar hook-basal body complex protein FliE [Geomonas sp.]|uniref:flagellar hook-basal body complex protein FliE n=1 Tax=Geomonas sp. TaxID=2651584 RepID=UPI0032C24369
MQISAIEGVGGGISQAFPAKATQGAQNPTTGFGKMMEDMVGQVNDLQQKADQSIQGLATGQSKGLHETMIAVEKASISFQFLTQVRTKAVEAYQEIMRMPV